MSGVRRGVLIGSGVVLAVIAVLLIALVVSVRRPLPNYDGSADLAGLSAQVTVTRDDQGVPQITADNPRDLFFAQGYIEASDRFFQMDVRRHITAGRLSELVGPNVSALTSDKLVRTLGWRSVAEQELPLLSATTRNNLQAYADGVNAYVESRSPGELSVGYVVLGTQVDLRRIEPWTPVDSLAWLKAVAWNLKGNYDSELGRAISYGSLSNVLLVNELYPPYPADHPTVLSTDPQPQTASAVVRSPDAVPAHPRSDPSTAADGGAPSGVQQLDAVGGDVDFSALQQALSSIGGTGNQFGVGSGVGSNAWVVSGQHTASGQPILAVDPHLPASMPGPYYEIGLHCSQVGSSCPFDVAGIGYAGVPGVVMGRNAQLTWGMANLPADTTDFFLERVIGDTVVVDEQSVPLTQRQETIRVAGEDDVRFTVRSTRHGPIISDVLPAALRGGSVQPGQDGPVRGEYDVALSWTGMTPGRTMDALFGMNAAADVQAFRAALGSFDDPPTSVVYADAEGTIGYQAVGRVPQRGIGPGLGLSDGTWPREGWNSGWDWTGLSTTADLPGEENPEQGFIVAANQKVSPGSTLTSDWDHGDRAARIVELLDQAVQRGDLTAADMREIQNDNYAAFAHQVLVPMLLATPPSDEQNTPAQRAFTAEAVDLLRDWDGQMDVDSPAAAYVNAVWASLLQRTFADQLPAGVQPEGDSRTNEVMRRLLLQQTGPWWDDISTPTITESRDQIIAASLVEARLTLTARLGKDPANWRWGQLHRLTPQNEPLGTSAFPGWAHSLMNGPTIELGGSSTTVNATAWNASSGTFAATSVPVHRYVVDLGDPDSSTRIDLTGVTGHPWSGEYGNQLDTWSEGGSYTWPGTEDGIANAVEDTLTLRPAPDGDGS